MSAKVGRRHVFFLIAVALTAAFLAAYGADAQVRARAQASPDRPARSVRPARSQVSRRAHQPMAGPTPPAQCTHPSWAPVPTQSYAATVTVRRAVVWSRAGGGSVVARVGRVDANGYPTVFAVLGAVEQGCSPKWFQIQLSLPPNGRSAWIRPWEVSTFVVHTRVVVQLSRRQLVAYRYGKAVFRTAVAVGRADAPTPRGRFFVDGRFVLSSSDGPFGVAVLGIAAHSNAPSGWPKGRPIALHGTNEPGSIGQAASHGCIRLRNVDMRRLFALAPAGTPVVISS